LGEVVGTDLGSVFPTGIVIFADARSVMSQVNITISYYRKGRRRMIRNDT
jgi:hypothetical protein